MKGGGNDSERTAGAGAVGRLTRASGRGGASSRGGRAEGAFVTNATGEQMKLQ